MRFYYLLISGLLGAVSLPAATLRVGPGQALASLSAALGQAQAGDTIYVHGGTYAEGTLIVDKPLTLIGLDFPVLDGLHRDQIMTVSASDVLIRGFQFQNTGQGNSTELAAIMVLSGNRVVIEENLLRDCSFGIYLSNTLDSRVTCNDIRGVLKEEQNSGNGIHLWKCEGARIDENYITGHRDGIYFEFVTDSDILNNHSEENLRYGLHFMFSHNDRYRNNRFERNGAGVAVMFSRQVEMTGNQFLHNWGSAAYGLLLKEISDSRLQHNVFEQNSAAVYMEGASRMTVEDNVFRANGWALRVQASCNDNLVRHNNFFGNSFDVATNGHLVLNKFENNYWDKYEGYDLDRDGRGDVPYRPVNLYAIVVEKMPYGLLLIRSFMVYLMDRAEKIIPALTPERLVDEQPAMKPF
jgi:nitrous oxidase accessory protein